MAITLRTAGTWATSTGNPTVTLPTHEAGDMLLVRVAWKSDVAASASATISTTGWTKIGQGNNGTTNASNGGGSVFVAAFFKVAESNSETNPTVTFADANPAAVVGMAYQKGSTEMWISPQGNSGPDTTSGTGHSATIASLVRVYSGDVVDFFTGIADDTTMTVPTITQTGVTLNTVTESPATALTSTTGFDISADGGYRTATAGTATAAAVVTGTLSTAETGTSWMTVLRVMSPPPTGQANARIKAIGVNWHGQAQATIKGISRNYGQAQAQIKQTYRVYSQAQAEIEIAGAICYTDQITEDAPIGWWRYGEPSGTNANDEIGSNDGTYTNTPILGVTGAITDDDNTAVELDGIDQHIQYGDVLDMGAAGSWELWFKRVDIGTQQWIMSKGSGQPNIFFWTSNQIFINDNSSFICFGSTVSDTTNWHHLVFTHAGNASGDQKIYIDGVDVTASPSAYTASSNSSNLVVGSAYDTGLPFSGSIDEVAIYNYALTPEQVAFHYELGANGCFAPSPQVFGQAQAQIKKTSPYPTTIYVEDTATRNVTTGFGAATRGGTWADNNSGTGFSVGDGSLVITYSAGNQSRIAGIHTISVQDTDYWLQFQADKTPATDSIQAFIQTRQIDLNNYYKVRAQITPANAITLSFFKVITGGPPDTIVAETTIARETFAPNTVFNLRMQTVGTSPTTLRAKVWQNGTSEPAAWDIEGTDSEASLQTSTGIGIGGFTGSSVSNTPIVERFDNVLVTTLGYTGFFGQANAWIEQTYRAYGQAQARITGIVRGYGQAMAHILGEKYLRDSFTRTVSNGWGTPDVGPEWVVSDPSWTVDPSSFSVDGSTGALDTPATQEDTIIVPRMDLRDIEMSSDFLSSPFTLAAQDSYIDFLFRNGWIGCWITFNGTASLLQVHLESPDNPDTAITSLTFTASTWYTVKFKAIDISSTKTAIYAKVFERGTSEPEWSTLWSINATPQAHESGIIAFQGYPGDETYTQRIDNIQIQQGIIGGSGQAQARIKQTYFVHGQAQAQIKQTYFVVAQANAWIENTYRGLGQAQAWIENTYRAFGQAQAWIEATYFAHGQAQARINSGGVLTYFRDTFTRTLSNTLGTPDLGSYLYESFDGTFEIDGSKLVLTPTHVAGYGLVYAAAHSGHRNVQVTFDFMIPTTVGNVTYYNFAVIYRNGDNYARGSVGTVEPGVDYVGVEGFPVGGIQAGNALNISPLTENIWYSVKLKGEEKLLAIKLWERNTPEPSEWSAWVRLDSIEPSVDYNAEFYLEIQSDNPADAVYFDNFLITEVVNAVSGQAQARIKQTYFVHGQAQAEITNLNTYNGLGQAQARIKQVYYGLGQSQAWVENTYYGLGQAQARIKNTYNGLGQAQARIKNTYNGLGQAQARIKQTYNIHGQAQARIKNSYFGLGQSQARIKNTYNGLGQANAQIKQTYFGLAQAQATIRGNAHGQAQGWIETTYNSHGQAQADIKQTYFGLGQSNAWIEQTFNVHGQAQAQIKQVYYGLGQAQAQIKQTYYGLGQARAWIENTYYGLGQSQAWIEQTYFALGQAQARILTRYNAHGQAQARIKQVYSAVAQAQAQIKQSYTQTGQAHALIRQTYYVHGQAHVWIEQTYYGLGQAQAQLKQTYYAVGQSQARILQVYNSVAQAQAAIKNTYYAVAQAQASITNTYHVVGQAQAKLNAFGVNQFGQAQGNIKFDGNAVSGQAQAKLNAYDFNQHGQANAQIKQVYYAVGQAQAQILQTYYVHGQSQAWIENTYYGLGQAQARILQVYYATGQAQAYIILTGQNAFGQAAAIIRDTYYGSGQANAKINAYGVSAHGQAQGYILSGRNSHGQANAYIKAIGINVHGQAQGWVETTYNVHGQAQALVKNTYSVHGQANALIVSTYVVHGQSRAWIENTYSGHGQAQGNVKQTYTNVGQAQAQIKDTYSSSGQANALIGTRNSVCGQAQGTIKTTYNQHGQANADILQIYVVSANAQARIKDTYSGSGQANTYIILNRFAVAQAQAAILAVYRQHGQAQGTILATYSRSGQTQALVKTTAQAHGQAQALILNRYNASSQAQGTITNGGFAFAQAQAQIVLIGLVSVAQAQAHIVKAALYGQAQALIVTVYTLKSVSVDDDRPIITILDSDANTESSEETLDITIILEDEATLILEISDEAF